VNAVLKSLNHLSVEEKLQLVQDLWDDIDKSLLPPMSAAVKQELDRRVAWRDANPGHGKTLNQIILESGIQRETVFLRSKDLVLSESPLLVRDVIGHLPFVDGLPESIEDQLP
jgi:putative addiction module component (TIGR02574 family)